jgi:hypothetical protein
VFVQNLPSDPSFPEYGENNIESKAACSNSFHVCLAVCCSCILAQNNAELITESGPD